MKKIIKKVIGAIGLFMMGCYFALMVEFGADATLVTGEILGVLMVIVSVFFDKIAEKIAEWQEG